MNSTRYKFYLAIPALLISLSAYAHEGEEHAEEAQELDCSAMEGSNHAAADMNDPVMQAMMMKCQAQLAEAEQHATQGHAAENLIGNAHGDMAHEEHGTAIVAGDAHAHAAGDHTNTEVVGTVAEQGHGDGAGDHGHGDHQ